MGFADRRLPQILGAGRVLFGLAVAISPRTVSLIFAQPADELGAAGRLSARLAGCRDVALGAGLALAPASGTRTMLAMNAAVDASDVVTSLAALRDGLPRRAALQSATAAAIYAAIELYSLGRRADLT